MNNAILEPKYLHKEEFVKELKELYEFLKSRELISKLANNLNVTRNTVLAVLQNKRFNYAILSAAYELMQITLMQEIGDLELLEIKQNEVKELKAKRLILQNRLSDNEYFLEHSAEYNENVKQLNEVL